VSDMESRNYFTIPDEVKIQAVRNVAQDMSKVVRGINLSASDDACLQQYNTSISIAR
jgi:hypothetical protein